MGVEPETHRPELLFGLGRITTTPTTSGRGILHSKALPWRQSEKLAPDFLKIGGFGFPDGGTCLVQAVTKEIHACTNSTVWRCPNKSDIYTSVLIVMDVDAVDVGRNHLCRHVMPTKCFKLEDMVGVTAILSPGL